MLTLSALYNISFLVLYEQYSISNGLLIFGNFYLQSGSKNKIIEKFGNFLMYCCIRSLTPQGLADTLCGSPYYMAPEIIENQKYDAKVIKDELKKL